MKIFVINGLIVDWFICYRAKIFKGRAENAILGLQSCRFKPYILLCLKIITGGVVQSQTAIFSKIVRDFMRDSPIIVPSGSSVKEGISLLAQSDNSCMTVLNKAGAPVGIVTEADVADRIAFQAEGSALIDTVMTSPVEIIDANEYLYHAIARMRRRSIRHMLVVGDDGTVVGSLDPARCLSSRRWAIDGANR